MNSFLTNLRSQFYSTVCGVATQSFSRKVGIIGEVRDNLLLFGSEGAKRNESCLMNPERCQFVANFYTRPHNIVVAEITARCKPFVTEIHLFAVPFGLCLYKTFRADHRFHWLFGGKQKWGETNRGNLIFSKRQQIYKTLSNDMAAGRSLALVSNLDTKIQLGTCAFHRARGCSFEF